MTTNNISILEDQLRECYGKVVYAHKTHEKCADILLGQRNWIVILRITMYALLIGSIISICSSFQPEFMFIATVLLTLGLTYLHLSEKIEYIEQYENRHREVALDLWAIREKYLSLLTDIRIGSITLDAAQTKRDILLEKLRVIYARSPEVNPKAYKMAQKALEETKEMTFSDPKELKRTTNGGGIK